jgi:dTDP-4-amino-4,6-dideoxygalactose transaminase
MNVPFLDLKAHHDPHRAEFLCAIEAVIERNAFAGGPFVQQFEEEYAEYCGARYAMGVGSGTEALWLALLAMGIGPGDEVITSPSSFIATAEAISFTGATPVFADIDERTYNLDPAKISAVITGRTKAIIPVHLFGQPADMDPILAIAREHGLRVLEDAAQAHGAEYKGRRIGSIGDAACFSFYPGKNLGAFGEGGAVVTDDPDLRDRINMLRDHGQSKKYHHKAIGWNGRMDGIQGAVLSVKLKHLDESNAGRREHAAHYNRLLAELDGVTAPACSAALHHVYHVYAIRVAEREPLMKALGERGVASGIHYPIPIHLQEAYQELGHAPGSFPVAERCAAEFVSLPMFPELLPSQVEQVAQALREILEARPASQIADPNIPVQC